MNIFSIPDSLAHHYKGRGIALATTDTTGSVTSLIYIRDLDPNFDDEIESIPPIIDDERIAAVARALERDFGFVRVGMVSSWEFIEL